MSAKRWIAFYPADWLNGTRGMSIDEIGVYIQVVATLYDRDNAYALDRVEHPATGKLTGYAFTTIAREIGVRADRLERLITALVKRGKLSIQAGYLTSRRVGEELQKRELKSRKAKENAQARWGDEGENVLNLRRFKRR